MAHRGAWAKKDPNEKKDYGFNWAGTIDDPGIAYGDPITASTWDVPSPLVKFSDNFSNGATTIWLTGGVDGETYILTNHVTTSGGRNYDESIKLRCKTK